MQPHLASTYAAVMAIVNLNCEEAYEIINVDKICDYLLKIKNNIDKTHVQHHPKNMWVFSDKENGTIFDHGKSPHKVIGTLPGAMAIHENGEMD